MNSESLGFVVGGGSDDGVLIVPRPRGFCAGVVRAIDIVRIALQKVGPPVYVRKEIVHNRHVVAELAEAGAIFVDEPART
jgi:4-hydroxy-3-methylbut-2-enyl diphosphate reductase